MIWYDKDCPYCQRKSYTANPHKPLWQCPYCLNPVNDSIKVRMPAFMKLPVKKEMVIKTVQI